MTGLGYRGSVTPNRTKRNSQKIEARSDQKYDAHNEFAEVFQTAAKQLCSTSLMTARAANAREYRPPPGTSIVLDVMKRSG